MRALALEGGFAEPPFGAARAFRAALDAMARPGSIHRLAGARPPAPLSAAAGALALALLDAETPVWLALGLAGAAVADWLTFHTGAPVTADRAAAVFALGTWPALMPLDGFAAGTPGYPDRSATLVAEIDRLEPRGAALTGPGVRGSAALSLPAGLAAARAALPPFPLGIDVFLTAGDRLAGLPRSTRIG